MEPEGDRGIEDLDDQRSPTERNTTDPPEEQSPSADTPGSWEWVPTSWKDWWQSSPGWKGGWDDAGGGSSWSRWKGGWDDEYGDSSWSR
eukprot:3395266-Pyramimonas_sp.AAC.1